MPTTSADGFRSVVFDCDSTLVGIEGIDELAGSRADEVRALTDAAMAGEIPLEAVYGRRLELIRPSRTQIDAVGRSYVGALVPDARATVQALLWLGKSVRVLSGGLFPPVAALAIGLGLEVESVAAVGIRFGEQGEYAGFDEASPLARVGGKAEVIRKWNLPRPTLLVGDGATDAEARPAVDSFAAYMGVAYRAAVADAADVVLRAASLAPVLALAAGSAERDRLRTSEWASLLARGEEILHGSADDPSTAA
ncbi:MAG: HAD-IB family phosphatase [Gemmatimonadetes bacterium]|nr:HAD-IB family phosphatase [Gemmatimonadota bacterium]